MQTPKLKISGNIEILRERVLPVLGEVLVSVGDKVTEGDLVLRTSLKSEIITIKIRELLSLGDEEISSYYKMSVGEVVNEGDLLFKRPGLFGYFSDEYRSAVSGVLEFVDPSSGFMGIRPASRLFEVNAYLRGTVVEVQEAKSIKVKSLGSGLLQGVYGRGRECLGELIYLDSIKDLGESCKNKIIGYASFVSVDDLALIVNSGASGLVVSSISSSILSVDIAALGAPSNFVFMVVDGFGKIRPSKKLINFFEQANGKDCSLSGLVQIRAGAIRPELIVHEPDLNVTLESEDKEEDLVEGSAVRVVRGEHIGEVGILKSFTASQIEFPSGIKSLGVEVSIGEDSRVYPLQNIETV